MSQIPPEASLVTPQKDNPYTATPQRNIYKKQAISLPKDRPVFTT